METDDYWCLASSEDRYNEEIRLSLLSELTKMSPSPTQNVEPTNEEPDRKHLRLSVPHINIPSPMKTLELQYEFKKYQAAGNLSKTANDNREPADSPVKRETLGVVCDSSRSQSLAVCRTHKLRDSMEVSQPFADRDSDLEVFEGGGLSKAPGATRRGSMVAFVLPEAESLGQTERNQSEKEPDPMSRSRTGLDGLQHLKKLLSVVEQLEQLRDANQVLQQKCAFLEDTKMLLKEQNSLLMLNQQAESPLDEILPSPGSSASKKAAKNAWPPPTDRRNSADTRRQSLVRTHQQRSQSASSICDLVEMQLEQDSDSVGKTPDVQDSFVVQAPEERRAAKLQKKWKQVKSVFSGKSDSGAISAEMLLRSNSKKAADANKKRSDRSFSYSGESYSKRTSRQMETPIVKEASPRTPSIVLADPGRAPQHPNRPSQISTATTDSSSRISCSEIPEEVSVFTPEEDVDDSAFAPWVEKAPPKRRQSSPNTSGTSAFLGVDMVPGHPIVRSSSFRVSKSAPEVENDDTASKSLPSTPIEATQVASDASRNDHILLGTDLGRKIKGPWVKVKGILQTRRDSLKSKSGKAVDDDLDDFKNDPTASDPRLTPTGGTAKRPSRKHSIVQTLTMGFAPQKNSDSNSALPSLSRTASGKRYSLSSAVVSPGTQMDLVALFGVNDDFSKKMLEWEEKKKKKNVPKGSASTKFSDDFIRKMEEWEQKRGLSGSKTGMKDTGTPSRVSPEGAGCPYSPQEGEEAQRFLSESFSRTVHDWEEVRRRHSESKEKDKSKKKSGRSQSTERDKAQHRLEKELRKIEKKEQKLEQELVKLSQLRQKLDSQLESSSASDKTALERRASLEVSKVSSKDSKAATKVNQPRSSKDTSLSPEDTHASPPDASSTVPVSPSTGSGHRESVSISQTSLDSLSSMDSQSMNCTDLDRSRRASLESRRVGQSKGQSFQMILGSQHGPRLKSQEKIDAAALTGAPEDLLRRHLDEKQEEIDKLQNKIRQMTNQFDQMNKVFTQNIAHFQKETWSSHRLEHKTDQSEELSQMLAQLKTRINLLQEHGDRMTKDIGQTQAKIAKEAAGRRQMEQRLMQNLAKFHLATEDQQSQATMSNNLAEVVVHLCSYNVKLLSTSSALRQCVIERNLLIQELERHLLMQEVINKLLLADIERHSLELDHMKEFHRAAVIKRWRTFNGNDYADRDELVSHTCVLSRGQSNFPTIPQSCKKIQTLLAQVVTDPEPLDVDTDWFKEIKQDAEEVLKLGTRGIQPDGQQSSRTKDSSAQTVTPFCNCDDGPSPSQTSYCLSPSPHRPSLSVFPSHAPDGNTGLLDKCTDRTLLQLEAPPCYKPRKSSAPEFQTDGTGEDTIWFKRSAFRPVASSFAYQESVIGADKEHVREKKEAHQKVAALDAVNPKTAAAPDQAGGARLSQCVDVRHSDSYVESSMLSEQEKVKEKAVDSDRNVFKDNSNQRRPSGNSSKFSQTRHGTSAGQQHPIPIEDHSDGATLPASDDQKPRVVLCETESSEQRFELETDILSSSRHSLYVRRRPNVVPLKETRIGGSSCDIPEISDDRDERRLSCVGTPNPLKTLKSTEKYNKEGLSVENEEGRRSSTSPFMKSSSPIVIRKLKSATELLNECGKLRMVSHSTSVLNHHRSGPINDKTHHPSTHCLKERPQPSETTIRTAFPEGSTPFSVNRGVHPELMTQTVDDNLCRSDYAVRSHNTEPDTGTTFGTEKQRTNHFKPIIPPAFKLAFEPTSRTAQDFPRLRSHSSKSLTSSSSSSIPGLDASRLSISDFVGDEQSSAARPVFKTTTSPDYVATENDAGVTKNKSGPTSRSSSRSAKKMCTVFCLQAMSVELTDDSTDSTLSNSVTPQKRYSSPPPPSPDSPQIPDHESGFHKSKGNWLDKPKRLFKVLK